MALDDFTKRAIQRTPRELASVSRAVSILDSDDLREVGQLLVLINRNFRTNHAEYKAIDLIQLIGALGEPRMYSSHGEVPRTLQNACSIYRDRLVYREDQELHEFPELLRILARIKAIHPSLVSAGLVAATEGQTGETPFDRMSLDSKAMLLGGCVDYDLGGIGCGTDLASERRATFAAIESSAHLKRECAHGLTALGFGEYALYACLSGNHIDTEAFKRLAGNFRTSLNESMTGDPALYRRLWPLYPAVVLAGCTLVPFDGGRLVNVEADGDRFHRIFDIENAQLTRLCPAQYRLRDKYLRTIHGIPVVRVLESEWNRSGNRSALIAEAINASNY